MPYQPAILGTARLNNFRLNYVGGLLQRIRDWRVLVYLDGELVRCRVRRGSLTIHDVLNDAPNTCSFALDGLPAPEPGMQVRITINSNTPQLLFSGALETTATTYEGQPSHVVYGCTAQDDTMRADLRRPFALFQNMSATLVATELVRQFAPTLTANHVQADLPAVTVGFDGTEGFNGCLRAVCKIIGGYFYWEDGDLHLFLEEASNAPDPLTNTTCSLLLDPPLAATSDESQLRTRVYGRGLGTTLLGDVLQGETILPVREASFFTATGGTAVVSTTPDGSPTERIIYTGVRLGGPGVMVGPGAAPSVALNLQYAAGGGNLVLSATYQYKYTFTTAAGESLPSPPRSIVIYPPTTDPINPLTMWNSGFGGPLQPGGTYRWTYTYVTAIGETAPAPVFGPYTQNPGLPAQYAYPTIPAGLVGTGLPILARRYYRTTGSDTTLRLVEEIAGNATVNITDTTADAVLATRVALAFTNTTGGTAVKPVQVPAGPAGTTTRKIYRSRANDFSLFKFQQTITDNATTTGAIDQMGDAELGANAPVTDTSGLTQPLGQVPAGSTSIQVSGAAALPAAGWVTTPGGDAVRYSGQSGNFLTGVPATGPGAIITSINYGDPLIPAPSLTGIQYLVRPLYKGARVHVFVQRDDWAAIAAAAARESTATYAADGIHENLLIDERRAEPSLTALCDADLAMFANPLVTVAYVSTDVKTKSGKPIVVTLTTPAIAATLVIHDVTITQLDEADGVPPRFATTASSVKFSLEDLLRRMSALLPE